MQALTDWLANYGSIVVFFVQLFYYLGIVIAAFWAVLLFKRFVDFKVPSTPEAPSAPAAASGKNDKPVAVDEFVD